MQARATLSPLTALHNLAHDVRVWIFLFCKFSTMIEKIVFQHWSFYAASE